MVVFASLNQNVFSLALADGNKKRVTAVTPTLLTLNLIL